MKNINKLLCFLLSIFLVMGLCACNSSDDPQDSESDIITTPPEIIFGTWYAHPKIIDAQIEISKDGTCVIDGQQQSWQAKHIEADTVTLTVGEGEEELELTFTRLTTNMPILADKNFGWSVKNPELWNYAIGWYNEETDTGFTLTLYELTQTECNIGLEAGKMTVEVLAGEWASYALEFTAEQAIVTAPDGKSTTYFPAPDGMITH